MKDARRLSLKANFTWTFIGNVVYAASQWGKLVIIAKMTNPESVGLFTLGLAFGAPVVILFNLGLRAVQATDVNKEFGFSDYLHLRIITSIFAFLVISLISFTAESALEASLMIIVVGFGKVLDAIGEIYYSLLQQNERMDRLSISVILKSLISLLTLGIILFLTRNLLLSITISVMTSVIVLILYDIPNTLAYRELERETRGLLYDLTHSSRLEVLFRLARFAFPLGITAMLISLNTNIPRYIVEHFLGKKELGIYAAMSYILVAGSTVVNALGNTTSPRLARYYSSNNVRGFSKLVFYLLGVCLLLGAGETVIALVGGKPLLTLIYTSEYAENTTTFVYLMVSGGFMYAASFLNYALTACRSYSIQPVIILASCLAAVGSGLLLIERYGILGIAWSAIITWFVQAGLLLLVIAVRIYKSRRESVEEKAYSF
jgi:O-antigen/teichoic acid export membrane protein